MAIVELCAPEELMDPNPDIHELFAHYNSLYFRDSLRSCLVSWSSSRMTSCAGTCKYQLGGVCEIRLSEPLLRFRSTADLKNTLLHEMIHAFLWIDDNNKNHSEHGPRFQAMMKEINSSSVTDLQRPSGGYNITIYHEFHEEVDGYRVHHWLCDSCGDLIKRAVNREPSTSDCIENMGHVKNCGKSSCHWHGHKMKCSGTYMKLAEPPNYKEKKRVMKLAEPPDYKEKKRVTEGVTSKAVSHMIRRSTKRPRSEEGTEDKSDVKISKMITEFLPISGKAKINPGNSCSSGDNFKREVEGKELMVIDDPLVTVPKRGRTSLCRKKRSYSCKKSKKVLNQQDQCPTVIPWLGFYAVEESDEDIEPLINKRTERRKKQKLLDLKRKAAEVEAMIDTSPFRESRDSSYEERCTNYPSSYGEGGRWRQKQLLNGPCEGASPVRDDIIDLSDD